MSIQELMRVKPKDRDDFWIKNAVREAVKLEFSTIPPYLCGMWSVKEGDGNSVYGIIETVVLEEMGHMGLACNILTALGESPTLNDGNSVPQYPRPLPASVSPNLTVRLVGLSLHVVKNVYMEIEKPEFKIPPIELAGETFPTIGAFYTAIVDAFHRVNPPLSQNRRQRFNDIVGVFPINSIPDVERAINNIIKLQGEGTPQSPFDDDAGDELAHYYQFWQIADQRIIHIMDGKAKWGDPMSLPFPDVYPMSPVPDGGWPDPPHAADPMDKPSEFDKLYTTMLDHLHGAWATDNNDDGQKELAQAVKLMPRLKRLAIHLMSKPLPASLGIGNYGPCFRLARP